MTHKRPLSLCALRARRRNARRSTGPRTKEGRRRASLNWRHPELPRAAYPMLKSLNETPEGYFRTWRDLLSIFSFLGPEFEPYVAYLAWDWWLKEHYALRSASERILHLIDARIEKTLGSMVEACGRISRKWRMRFQREIGSTGDLGMRELRLAIETRLPAYRRLARKGKLTQITPLEAALYEFQQALLELEKAF